MSTKNTLNNRVLIISLIMLLLICGCGTKQEQTDIVTTDIAALEESEAFIQINGVMLNLNKATVNDFIDAGAYFGFEDTDDSEVLNWIVNANQLEVIVYLDNLLELTLNRADSGSEKLTGECIVGSVEVRLLNIDVLTTDINTLPSFENVVFNEGIVFGDTLENVLSAYGTPDRDFIADYGEVDVRQLDFESNKGYKAYCQLKDDRIYCFILNG